MKIKDIAWIAFSVLMVGYLIYKIARNSFTDHFLGNNPQITKAIIIDERNYMGNQPVKPEFSYSYLFRVNGKEYKGNAHDRTLIVGDTVEVKYNNDYPSINKPLHPKE
jgi:FtsP/CotA-like multicopper oxidase with cupredoxin domain